MSDDNSIPTHVGFILDGNRRWAKQQSLPSLEGHRQGAEVFKKIALATFDRGVQYVSAYVFSTENWSRTKEEVKYLMGLVVKATDTYLNDFHEKGIKIVILGKREGLDEKVVAAIEKTEQKTAMNTNGTLALCFNYGGKDEIIEATKQLIASNIAADDITEEMFSEYVYGPDVPPIDLLIRTSGEQRLSGFMLWRAAYAELLFTDTFWPAYTSDELESNLLEFANRQRRFGG